MLKHLILFEGIGKDFQHAEFCGSVISDELTGDVLDHKAAKLPAFVTCDVWPGIELEKKIVAVIFMIQVF